MSTQAEIVKQAQDDIAEIMRKAIEAIEALDGGEASEEASEEKSPKSKAKATKKTSPAKGKKAKVVPEGVTEEEIAVGKKQFTVIFLKEKAIAMRDADGLKAKNLTKPVKTKLAKDGCKFYKGITIDDNPKIAELRKVIGE